MKHVGIWRDFLATDLPFCLVFEDDVFLAADFTSKLNRCIAEFGSPGRKAIVYLGNGGTYYKSWWQLEKGRHLYSAPHGRCADSYLMTRAVAEARVNWFDRNTLSMPIDHQVHRIDKQADVEILWFERPVVEQGSQNGAFSHSYAAGKWRPVWYKRLEWNWKKYRHQLFGHTGS
jgi:glycosyl transferase family 25